MKISTIDLVRFAVKSVAWVTACHRVSPRDEIRADPSFWTAEYFENLGGNGASFGLDGAAVKCKSLAFQ